MLLQMYNLYKSDTLLACNVFLSLIIKNFFHLQMLSSLKRIMSLPDETSIYCGHEYTLVGCFYFHYVPCLISKSNCCDLDFGFSNLTE